jgi:hypothetical protein
MIDSPPNQSQGYYCTVDVTVLEDMSARGWWGLLPYNTPVLRTCPSTAVVALRVQRINADWEAAA